jgi:hypothetical protein
LLQLGSTSFYLWSLCLCLVPEDFLPIFLDTHCRRASSPGISRAEKFRGFKQPLPPAFFHTHTGERLNIVYRDGSGYDPESLTQLNHYLRDHRTGEVHEYDPRVFDLLHDLATKLGDPNLEIDVICGYRTPMEQRVPAPMDMAWPSTVCICKQWLSTFECLGFRLHA